MMHYLYGDSSTSPFTSNFLEFLRDAIDFSVYVLEADRRIKAGRERMDQRRLRAQGEIEEIEVLGRAVEATIATTPKGSASSPASECADRMKAGCEETVRASIAAVRARLAGDIADAEQLEETEREGCLGALLGLLEPHVPPDASAVLRLGLTETGTYDAVLSGSSAGGGLTWQQALHIPEGHPFSHTLRVEALKRRLEVDAPDLTGWIKKQVTVRPQHLERLVMTQVTRDGSKMQLCLRTEPGSDEGFDIESDAETGHVAASRLVAGTNQAAAGPFDVDDEDAPKLIALCDAVRAELAELTTTSAFEAKFGDTDFEALPSFIPVVERLVAYLSPLVHEIAKHSLEPDELVLRRPLADNRREEIFVSKTTLRDKYENLPEELGSLFVPLALRASLSRSLLPLASEHAAPATRSELPPSNPPLAPAKLPARIAPPPPLTPVFVMAADSPSAEPPADAAPPKSASASAGEGPASAPAASAPAASAPAAPVSTKSAGTASRVAHGSQARKEQLLAALRKALEKILELDAAGRQPDAHRECAILLEGSSFPSHSPEDQRRVLKLLFVLESRASQSDARLRALRAGRDRARTLTERFADPADYELLGLCQMALEDTAAAAETFRKGLELESARNAGSELCTRLRRHAAAS